MQKDIKQNWKIPYPPETVWKYLTDPEMISIWLMENDFRPEVGHKFMFHTKPQSMVGFDGKIYCEVLEVSPYTRLSYTWRGGPGDGSITLDTVVIWNLKPTQEGTEIELQQNGFTGMKRYLSYVFMNEGWRSKIRKKFLALMVEREKIKIS